MSGSFLLIVGISALYFGKDLNFGSMARMGPGFMPRVVGVCIVVLSALVVLRGLRVTGEMPPSFQLVPFLSIVLAPVLFAILIKPAGLFITAFAVFSLVRVACTKQFSVEAFLAPFILAVVVCAIFIGLLGQPLPLFWY